MKKGFDGVPGKVIKWTTRKKSSLKAMVRAVKSSYDGAKTKVRARSAYSEKFEVKVGTHRGYGLLLLLFTTVVDNITENERRGKINEVLQADVFLLMSKTIKDLGNFGIGRK